jgi:uncharacterized SAM-binding protein YcdF (DUF218 family)
MHWQGQITIGGRKKRKIRRFLVIPLLILVAGSIYPHYYASRLPAPGAGRADALLVLAGGENRIVAGLKALQGGKAARLYILGTGPSVPASAIVPGYAGFPEELRREIRLEGWSETTLENAVSAKGIVAENRFTRVILVTSDYHLPRAFLAVRSAIPDTVRIEAMPVRSEWKGADAKWRKARLFLYESWKYWGYRIMLRWE